MQCSVYIWIQDGGDRTHDKIIAHWASYRKCGVGADFLTETRRTQRTGIRLRSSDSYFFTRHLVPPFVEECVFQLGRVDRDVAVQQLGHALITSWQAHS